MDMSLDQEFLLQVRALLLLEVMQIQQMENQSMIMNTQHQRMGLSMVHMKHLQLLDKDIKMVQMVLN